MIVRSFISVPVQGPPSVSPAPLPISWIVSGATNWCWAACVAMLATWKQTSPEEPCDVATKYLKEQYDCCANRSNCNCPIALGEIPGLLRDYMLDVDATTVAEDYELVREEIRGGRAILAVFDVAQSAVHHAAIIHGFRDDTKQIHILDPSKFELRTTTFDDLPYDIGRWKTAWSVA